MWDGQRLLRESDASYVTQALYSAALGDYGPMISQYRASGGTRLLHPNAQGTITNTTNTTGSSVDSYIFDAFGEPISVTGYSVNPHRYIGQQGYFTEPALGLDYVRARWYRPGTGSWLSADPVPSEPRYQYVGGRPTVAADGGGRHQEGQQHMGPSLLTQEQLEWARSQPDYRVRMPQRRGAPQAPLGGPNPMAMAGPLGFERYMWREFVGKPTLKRMADREEGKVAWAQALTSDQDRPFGWARVPAGSRVPGDVATYTRVVNGQPVTRMYVPMRRVDPGERWGEQRVGWGRTAVTRLKYGAGALLFVVGDPTISLETLPYWLHLIGGGGEPREIKDMQYLDSVQPGILDRCQAHLGGAALWAETYLSPGWTRRIVTEEIYVGPQEHGDPAWTFLLQGHKEFGIADVSMGADLTMHMTFTWRYEDMHGGFDIQGGELVLPGEGTEEYQIAQYEREGTFRGYWITSQLTRSYSWAWGQFEGACRADRPLPDPRASHRRPNYE